MNLKNFHNIIECAGVALINNGRIFLIRPFYGFSPQHYAIPKGHLEKSESPQKCAKREFYEETGINIDDKKLEFLTYVYTKVNRNTVKKVIVYKAEGTGNEIFCRSIFSNNGSPENIYGEYVNFDIARDIIVYYQVPIINKLIDKELSSFYNFYSKKLGF